jgi:elongation factor G
LKVLDGGVGVFCGSGGVEPQSETNWRYANDSGVARVIFVNKLDRMGADFYRVVKQVEDVLAANPLVMVLPIGIEDDFKGLVDLLSRKAYVWDDTGLPENYTIEDIPADMTDKVEEWREKLIETAVEQDDDLMRLTWKGKSLQLKTSSVVSAKERSTWISSRPIVVQRSRTRVSSWYWMRLLIFCRIRQR